MHHNLYSCMGLKVKVVQNYLVKRQDPSVCLMDAFLIKEVVNIMHRT